MPSLPRPPCERRADDADTRPRARLTMRGARDMALLALTLGLAAALFDAEPLWVPAVALALLSGGAVVWVALGSRGLRVRRTLSARRVVEGEPLDVVIEVRAGTLPLPTGRLVDPLLQGPVALATGRRRSRIRIEARFARRGRRTLEAPKIVVSDPLSLATRTVQPAVGADEVLVLPRVERVTAPGGGEDDHARARGREVATAEVDVDGLRPLREGTSAARIYWPAVARGAEPMERRLAGEGDGRPLVVLDPRGAATPEDLDAAVRAAASLTVHLARSGGCSLLLPGDKRPTALDRTLSGWPHLHARLAVVPDEGRPLLTGLAGRRGDVLYVCARIRATPPGGAGSAAGARLLVVPRGLPGRRAVFAVAGCQAYALQRARGSRRPRAGAGAT
jgi:uncharacterized protein (DUF58 family)